MAVHAHPRIGVLVVEDHTDMRHALRLLIDAEPDMQVVGEAASGRQAVTLAGDIEPDVIVVDPRSRDLGRDEIPQLRRLAAIVVYSLASSADGERAAASVGADGFVSKAANGRQVLEAIRVAAAARRDLVVGV